MTTAVIGNVIFRIVAYNIWIMAGGAESFLTSKSNHGCGLATDLFDRPGLIRLADCETKLYGSLKSEASRN